MAKIGRTYAMTIQVADDAAPNNTVVVRYPLTLNLDVRRSTLSSANTGHFLLYNLKEDTRRRVLKDRWVTAIKDRRTIVLNAGYVSEPKLPIIFKGDIRWAYSYRQKQDWVTEIEAFDGGDAILNGQASLSAPTGYDIRSVIRNLIGSMPGVTAGAIGDVGSSQNARGISVSGNSWDAVKQVAPNAESFIDNGVANVLAKNEYVNDAGQIFLISSASGLLETPRKYEDRIDVKIIFEPRMKVGMLVQIQSLEAFYNGVFCVKGVQHTGMISGAFAGQLYTTLSVWRGTEGLKGVNG